MSKICAFYLIVVLSLLALAALAGAAKLPLEAGPGTIHVRSAQIEPGISYRSITGITSYGSRNYYGNQGKNDALIDVWAYQLMSYAPSPAVAVLLATPWHGEKWTINNRISTGLDNSLGCLGDFEVNVKYKLPLAGESFDLALQPGITIPMKRSVYKDPQSQTGKVDFGGKVLADLNFNRINCYINAGFFTRGDENPMVPLGAAAVYRIDQAMAAFFEVSAELRIGDKTIWPDSTIVPGNGMNRTEARITPGFRLAPWSLLGVDLAMDLGLTSASAPWQAVVGFSLPATGVWGNSQPAMGMITGVVRDNRTGNPLKCMVSFPGSDVQAVLCDTNGQYQAKLAPGMYRIQVLANGYRATERKMEIQAGESTSWDVELNRREGNLALRIAEAGNGYPLEAEITSEDAKFPGGRSAASTGEFQAALTPGNYSLTIRADGHVAQTVTVSVKDKEEKTQSVLLLPEVVSAPPAPVTPPSMLKPPAAARTAATKTTPAVKAAPAAAKASPEEIAAIFKAGVQQYMNEDYAKAQASFQQVVKADPGNVKAKEYLNKTRERLKKIKG